jgi:integrase
MNPTKRRDRGLRQRGRIWWVRYCRGGERFEESSHSTRKGDAIDLLKLREGAGVKGIPVTPHITRLTFDEAAADLVTEYQTNGRRSLAGVKRWIDLHLMPFFRGARMSAIATTDVRTYIKTRQEAGAANATINRDLAALKRMYSLAIQAGKLLYRPHIPMLEEHNTRHGFFEAAQFRSLRDHLPADLRPVVTFAYLTGWRVRSEVLPLQWAQVDRQARTVRLEPGTTKNQEARVVVYGETGELHDVIEDQWAVHRTLAKQGTLCPFVFHRDGEPILNFRRAWAAACNAAGCPGRIPHDFRRTAVRNLVRAGVPERVAMQITGHKTRSVFERYNIVSEGDLEDAARKLDAALSGTKVGQSRDSDRQRADREAS